MTAKRAGDDCPACGEMFCAEHAQLGQPPRWTCGKCGASGELTGLFTARKPAAPVAEPPSTVKPHWRKQAGNAGLILLVVLAVSLIANAVLWSSLDDEQTAHAVTSSKLEGANEATRICNRSISRLEEAAREQGAQAEKDRQAAAKRREKRNQQADRELATPPTVPGDDCKSAKDRVRRILAERKKL